MPDHDLHPSLVLQAYPLIPLFPIYHMVRQPDNLVGDLIRDILTNNPKTRQLLSSQQS